MTDIGSFTPQVSVPHQSGIRFGSSGAEGIGHAVSKLGNVMQEIAQRRQHAEDSNTAFTVLNETELGVAQDIDEARRAGLSSNDYQAKVTDAIAQRESSAQERIDALKTEKVREYANHTLGNALTRHRVSVLEESQRMFFDEDRGATAANAQDLVNLAINASDDAGYALYQDRLKQLFASKAGNTLTHAQAENEWEKAQKTIQVERLKAQIRRVPNKVEEILGGAAGQGMPEHVKDSIREYSDAVIRKRVEQENQILNQAERVFKAQSENVELEVQEQARKKTITKDQIAEIARRYKGPMGEPIFTSEKVHTLQKMVDDNGALKSDPEAMKRLNLQLQAATTVEQIDSVLALANKAYLADRVNMTDWGHLDTRAREFKKNLVDEVRATYKDAHEQVMKEIDATFRIEPFMQSHLFDERAQAKEKVLRDLNKVSALRGGDLDPRQWWDDNRVRYTALVPDIIDKQIELRAKSLPAPLRKDWMPETLSAPQIATSAKQLEQQKSEMSPAEYRRHRATLLELHTMVRERAFAQQSLSTQKQPNSRGR